MGSSKKSQSNCHSDVTFGQPIGIHGQVSREHVTIVVQIQSCLSRDLLPTDLMFDLPTDCHPTRGHCAVATEAAYHLFGKAHGYRPYVYKDKSHGGTNTHWWLFNPQTNALVDPTAEQIDGDPQDLYSRGHGQTFRTVLPSKRAAEIIRRVETQALYSKVNLSKRR